MAVDFMESQIQDPKLREIVRPDSKCRSLPLPQLDEKAYQSDYQTIVSDHCDWTISTRLWPRRIAPLPETAWSTTLKQELCRLTV